MTTPENRIAVGRDNVGRFAKGVTGNPGGRPKGLASYVREQTRNGEDLADFVLMVFHGENIDGHRPSTAMRMEAATWLSDRAFGRPVQGILHADVMSQPWKMFDDWSTEDLKELVRQGREARALGEAKVIEGESHPVGFLKSDSDAGVEAT